MSNQQNVTGEWIKEEVANTFSQFKATYDPETFVLNTNAAKFQNRLKELRDMCPHKFENGKCIYCSKSDGGNNE